MPELGRDALLAGFGWRARLAEILESHNAAIGSPWLKAAIWACRHEQDPVVFGNTIVEAFEATVDNLHDRIAMK